MSINMKRILNWLLSAVTLLFCTNFFSACHEEPKPNIIFILSDDLSWGDLSINGQTHFATPNIDKLASGGMQFSNAYAGAPECAPSRASLMTGRHMGHCRIRANRSVRGQDHLKDEDLTVAELLRNAGYTTGFTGKWGIGLPGTEGVPHKQGFDFSIGFYDQLRAHTYYPYYLMENGEKVAIPENYGFDMGRTYQQTASSQGLHTYDENGKLIPDGIKDPSKAINSADYIHEKALQFIKDHHETPFFLYYATQLVHGPCITPNLGKYKDMSWDQKHKEWAAMVEHLDTHVGEIIKTLEELEIVDRTIIFFASDNGYSQWGYFDREAWVDDPIFKNKGPWPYGKFISRDGGMRIPFVVYWFGKIQPGISDHITALYDFMATAAELAGEDGFESDGLSILPTLLGNPEKQQIHDYLYWENGSYNTNAQSFYNSHAQSLRVGDYFIYRPHPDSLMQVYNLVSDLQCRNDISLEEKDVVKQAEEFIQQAHADSEWYVNPGEDVTKIGEKRREAERTGTVQESTTPNSKYQINTF